MAIQTVNIGAIVNDGTGDPLRTAYSKLNDNFTDTANAASRLVQTTPTDATAEAVLLTGAYGMTTLLSAPSDIHSIDQFGFYQGANRTNSP